MSRSPPGYERPPKTGWPPPPLLQDDCRALFRWFAERLGSRRLVREACAEFLPPACERHLKG